MLRVRIFVNGEARWSREVSRNRLYQTLAIIVKELRKGLDRYLVVADDGALYSILWRQQ